MKDEAPCAGRDRARSRALPAQPVIGPGFIPGYETRATVAFRCRPVSRVHAAGARGPLKTRSCVKGSSNLRGLAVQRVMARR